MTLSWESRSGTTANRFWSTVCQSVEDWRSWSSELGSASAPRALAFAMLAELGAAASFGAVAVIGFVAVLPGPAMGMLTSHHGWGWFCAATLAFAALMVSLHLLWAICLEALIRGKGPHAGSVSHSLRFSLYVCGWDLMTSPLGLLWAVSVRGASAGVALVAAATTVPTRALLHYLVEVRGLTGEQARSAARRSFVLPMLIAGSVALSGVLLWWLR